MSTISPFYVTTKSEQNVSQWVFNENAPKLQNRAHFSELVEMSTISTVCYDRNRKLDEDRRAMY